MTSTSSPLAGAIAATRFGLGARPGEIAAAAPDPRGWLLAQLEPGQAPSFPGLAGSAERLAAARQAEGLEANGAAALALRTALAQTELFARTRHAAATQNSFRERWTLFWVNHFALQSQGGSSEMLSGAFAREAIEPHQFSRFEDLLVAALKHPAMLIALNQTESVGPDSIVGRAQKRGINENLAREAMELHSVGLEARYTQADVRELAYALAGWTIADTAGPPETRGRFVVDPTRRQPGGRTLLARYYPQGSDQAEAMLRDLARRPETYRRLAFKLARHVVADRPDPVLVERLTLALVSSGGSLAALARALVEAPEAWASRQAKFKTPYEHLVSAHRALDLAPLDAEALWRWCGAQACSPLWSPSPRGASDEASAWATSYGLAARAGSAQALAARTASASSLAMAEAALGPLLSKSTRVALSGGVSPEGGTALALMSPEFLRR